MTINNADGATVRTDINSALQALASSNAGTTDPITATGFSTRGQWWMDRSAGLIKQRNEANDAWISRFNIDDNGFPGDIGVYGDINFTDSAPNVIKRSVTTDALYLMGGTSTSDGSYIRLNGGASGTAAYNANLHTFNSRAGTVMVTFDTALVTMTSVAIVRSINNGVFTLSGGTSGGIGAHIALHGGAHGNPNLMIIDADTHVFRDQAATKEYLRIDETASYLLTATRASDTVMGLNRIVNDGLILSFLQDGTEEGYVSVTGNVILYQTFCGAHPTQLKDGQSEPPMGAVVVSTGEIIPCNVEQEREVNTPFKDVIKYLSKDAATEPKFIDVDDNEDKVTKAVAVKKKIIIVGKKKEKQEVFNPDCYIKDGNYYKAKQPELVSTGFEYDEITGKDVEVFEKKFQKKTIKIKPLREGVYYNKETKEFYKAKTGYRIDVESKKIYETKTESVQAKEYFTYIDTTTKAGDKAVYGVWVGKSSDDAKGQSFGDDTKAVYSVAQVGLYKCRVTDTNGNITNGDYLETSTRIYEAQKQTGKARVNATIGKAQTDVDWSEVKVDRKLKYKWKLIPILF